MQNSAIFNICLSMIEIHLNHSYIYTGFVKDRKFLKAILRNGQYTTVTEVQTRRPGCDFD